MDSEKIKMGRFKGIFKPTAVPLWMPLYNPSPFLFKDSFKLTTLFVIGALLQCGLFAILPSKYAFVPASAFALSSIISTILEWRASKMNQYAEGVVPGRTTAQIPDPATGTIPGIAASRSLVVFHLGVRFNHPLGLLSPGGREIGAHFQQMNDDLQRRATEYGLYHVSNWLGADGARNNTLLNIYYFRDVAGLHRFAHDAVHRKGWDWYNGFHQTRKHIGIFHESFVAAPQRYETIYGNMKPTLLGAASLECNSEETGDRVWVNTLVSADVGPLRGMTRRMGNKDAPLDAYA
ncbi:hypothetical protein CTA2_2514 [Colletotrichum tanaceti]|uniref:Monooxygenase n=1 Tax=Colletotrichum tanaceti TaxID=1306861 RepID=A0A4U6XC94_9PEZI|nr:hypothetical protein CTA2_2514 [Colletotrichum tanaceti]TKW53358.1 hypothetical protein CTA1_7653 [Colletotrichum tanaceti]